jgi:hypothetical protein
MQSVCSLGSSGTGGLFALRMTRVRIGLIADIREVSEKRPSQYWPGLRYNKLMGLLGGLGVENYFGPAFVAVVEVFVGVRSFA